MGIGDAHDEHNDNNDEHLYSRRASKNSLYSTATGSSHPSSPTFSSRRGSAVTVILNGDSEPDAHQQRNITAYPRTRHNGEFDNPYLIYGPPSPSLSSRYAHHDEIVGNRNAHASELLHSNTPANYDGIIKHPSRYPYARSHYHHPYARAYSSSGRSPSFSHPSPQHAREQPLTLSQQHNNIDDAFAHPRSLPHPYYAQKRHSFAALRTATAGAGSSSSFNDTNGGGSGGGINGMSPLNGPIVRLPSIDHGLPPFSGTEGGMLLPLRRGSLTDPLLHAHARNTPASSSNLSMQASTFATGSGGAGPTGPSSYGGGINGPSHQYKLFPAQAQPSSPLVASTSSAASAGTAAAPRFGAKRTKTLFPQQHGASSANNTSASAIAGPASSISPAMHTPTSIGAESSPAAVSLLGTKRKLDSSVDASITTESLGGTGTLVAVGDYFTSAAPNVTKAVTVPASSSGLPVPIHNGNERRASQTYLTRNDTERLPEAGKITRAVPLPTPTSTDSAAGESGSAASSDRRSSDGSNGLPANANGVDPTASRYGNIVQRHPLSYVKEVDAETKSGYAFPTQRPSSGSSAPPNSVPLEQPAYYSSHDAPQPYPSHTDQQHQPGPPANYQRDYPRMEYQNSSVGPSVLQQPPPSAFQPSAGPSNQFRPQIDGVHGSSLQPDLRSKASAVFGAARPGYSTNGQPPLSVHASNAGISGPGLSISAPPGALSRMNHLKVPPAGSGSFGTDMDSQGGSNLPYARSPALKVSHKIAERKRRREMKELFDELRDCVPTVPGSSTPGAAAPAPPPPDVGGRGIKSSKWEILAKAIEYINKLQYEHQELSNQVIELQGLNQAFQEELHAIKSGQGGIASVDGASTGQMNGAEGVAGSISGDASSVVSNGPPSAGLMNYSGPSHGQPYAQQGAVYQPPHQVSAVEPSPSPASGLAMPPLQHQSHSMPAVIGHHPVLSPVPALHHSHSHSQSHAHSASQSPMQYPISAPPHMQTHYLGPITGNEHSPQQFGHPQSRQHHQNYLPSHQNHQRTVSNPSQFEHAGSAPPALQQHPHQQVQYHPQQSILGNSSVANSPVPTHQNLGFFPPLSQYQSNGSLPPDTQHGRAIFSTQGQGQHRPASSLRSHTSNHSIHSLHSVSPQPSHIQLQQHQAMQQRHNNVMQEDWSPAYASPRSLPPQISNSTTPGPTSQSVTPMMSPVNAGY